jgi:3-methyladenine DNA glycosylase AlkC
MAEEKFLFRNVFSPKLVKRLAKNIKKAWPSFEEKAFCEEIIAGLTPLSFYDRCKLITSGLEKYLPKNFKKAVKILLDALEPECKDSELTGDAGFAIMPQTAYVRLHGLDDFDTSINALYEMTKRFSAEFDIRFFIQKYPAKTMKFLHKLTKDPSPFARRLASEGTRPRLPLAFRLKEFQKDPSPVIEILELLKNDPNLMVRRSVANNLNDIAKDNPEVVVSTLKKWSKNTSKEMQWLIRHSLRTLLKAGNRGALELMGFPINPKIEVKDISLKNTEIKLGDNLEFSLEIKAHEDTNLMIDYLLHFKKANGKLKPKVFKLTKKKVKKNETVQINKKHPLKKLINRKYYSGEQAIQLQINGKTYSKHYFNLET